MSAELSILFVPFGTARVAATRYRIYQYLPYLAARNIRFRVFSLISDMTTKQMINSPKYAGIKKIFYYLQVSLEKLIRFIPVWYLAGKYKVVFLQRSTLPFGLSALLKMRNRNIVFDLDDAIFIPDSHEKGLIGFVKERSKATEVADILRVSKVAIVENDYIRDYCRRYCLDIRLIPGPIDTERNFVRPKTDKFPVVIGWIGSPSTSIYLDLLAGVLTKIHAKEKVVIRLIGAGDFKLAGLPLDNQAWSVKEEVGQLQSFDIGLMPMPDNEWTRGKLGAKMLQYMSVGVPTVASYTPTNAWVINDGVNGYLVRSEDEWVEKLTFLIKDASLREKIGSAGRKTVEERFSVSVNAPKFLAALTEAGQVL